MERKIDQNAQIVVEENIPAFQTQTSETVPELIGQEEEPEIKIGLNFKNHSRKESSAGQNGKRQTLELKKEINKLKQRVKELEKNN